MKQIARWTVCRWIISVALAAATLAAPSRAQQLSLQALVTPSTTVLKDGHPVVFALHGFIEFKSLAELFPYIDAQTQHWKPEGILAGDGRRRLAHELLRRGVESRIISMTDERPLEVLVTHTREELLEALGRVKEPVPPGYAEAFIEVQQKWKHSLNCWSAAPSIPARVLSNWYPIEEGIELYGATYDSTEHFWQAVKYHPAITVAGLTTLLEVLERRDWKPWMARLDDDPNSIYPMPTRSNFCATTWGRNGSTGFAMNSAVGACRRRTVPRLVQQRGTIPFRFSANEEKILWGDLADLFHLIYTFSQPDDPIRKSLAESHFDAVRSG